MRNMKNPWLNISWKNTIADCDRNYPVTVGHGKKKLTVVPFGSQAYISLINKKDQSRIKNGKKPVDLRFDCLPEPFYGDPKSEVYCLNMNPGEPDPDFNQNNDIIGGYQYQSCCQAMLNHQLQPQDLIYDGKSIVKNKSDYDEAMNNIMENLVKFKKNPSRFCPRPHLGDIWQRDIWQYLIAKLGREPKLFSIEFFPYHSTSSFIFPEDLPSYEYRNDLIDNALKTHKLIIVMRKTNAWFKIQDRNIGDRLKEYPNKVFLKNSQRVWLTPGNFCWEIPEKSNNGYVPYAEPWACHSIEDIINKL